MPLCNGLEPDADVEVLLVGCGGLGKPVPTVKPLGGGLAPELAVGLEP